MIVICDIETNALYNPTHLWLIVCKDIETNKVHVFRRPDENPAEFLKFAAGVTTWIGHNFIGYDYRIINRLVSRNVVDPSCIIDTLIVSRLTNFLRPEGHSLASFGPEFNLPKLDYNDWTRTSDEMVAYCIRDVELNHLVYKKFLPFITSSMWKNAMRTEHDIGIVCNDLQDTGFYFDRDRAERTLASVSTTVSVLRAELVTAFPPREHLIREFTPRGTKFGTISKTSVPRSLWGNIADYEIGKTYRHTEFIPFNPGSSVQIVQRLNEVGWKPKEKTDGHYQCERDYDRDPDPELEARLAAFRITGWKCNEANLATLPETAPPAAFTLARYLLLANRQRTLVDWLDKVRDDGRIHGTFNGIGAWTQRMSHSDPNLANVPTEKPQDTDEIKDLNNTLRSLFCVPKGRLLVGVDADSIQLRILAHYIQDPKFIEALTRGDKAEATDVHSLNAAALGSPCKGRRDAKTFIYAWLLGAGIQRVSEILGCSYEEAKEARENFINYYPGLKHLRKVIIPRDAQKGYFKGLDGRHVICYGNNEDQRNHYMLGGYLQNGESTVMKKANLLWRERLTREKVPFWQVNFVHDEWQTETTDDFDTAQYIAEVQADSIRIVGEQLNLKCPLAGSILSAHETLAIGHNWRDTH